MRRKLNLDLTILDRLALLLHGAYGSGKTHFQGDFLRWAKAEDHGIMYLTIGGLAGEFGERTLAGMGLGNHSEEVDTLADFDAVLGECAKTKVFALAVDSLAALQRLVLIELVGSLRHPDPKLDGERAKSLWGQIKMHTMQHVLRARASVPYQVWVAANDRQEDPVANKTRIGPSLDGAAKNECVGWFDFVAQLRCEVVGPTSIRRTLYLTPNELVSTRQRLPAGKAIVKEIPVPEGHGGWTNFYAAVQEAMK